MKIKVGISNRHAHLTRETCDILFGKGYELTEKRKLTQLGEFASNEQISIKGSKGLIDYVRIVGVLRPYTQVEVLRSDAITLRIIPPVTDSGNLTEAVPLTLIGPQGSVTLDKVCIIPRMHIHMSKDDLIAFNRQPGEMVSVKTKENKIIPNIIIKSDITCALEFHLDKEEALQYNLQIGDEVEIID